MDCSELVPDEVAKSAFLFDLGIQNKKRIRKTIAGVKAGVKAAHDLEKKQAVEARVKVKNEKAMLKQVQTAAKAKQKAKEAKVKEKMQADEVKEVRIMAAKVKEITASKVKDVKIAAMPANYSKSGNTKQRNGRARQLPRILVMVFPRSEQRKRKWRQVAAAARWEARRAQQKLHARLATPQTAPISKWRKDAFFRDGSKVKRLGLMEGQVHRSDGRKGMR